MFVLLAVFASGVVCGACGLALVLARLGKAVGL
jgi:hypothetical protein